MNAPLPAFEHSKPPERAKPGGKFFFAEFEAGDQAQVTRFQPWPVDNRDSVKSVCSAGRRLPVWPMMAQPEEPDNLAKTSVVRHRRVNREIDSNLCPSVPPV